MPIYDCTLWELLKNRRTTLTPRTRIGILCKTLDGLIHIQNHKLAHLDIKPSNIMVKLKSGQWDGQTVVICDFGLCSKMDILSGTAGTPGCGSPEQFIGKPSPRSDNYAFGKLAILTIFPWNMGWNLLAQPIKNGISEIANPSLLNRFQIISSILNVRI